MYMYIYVKYIHKIKIKYVAWLNTDTSTHKSK